MKKIRLEVPGVVYSLAKRLEDAGFETWAVGGAVREALRGCAYLRSDWDLATRATPKQMRQLFRRTVPLGPRYGTLGVFGKDGVMYEVTTFRHDVKTFGRKATVTFASTIEEDLARRDFTVNAMAWHPIRGELLDLHQGLRDLKERILRTVGSPRKRFREDYLRVLRGLRFAGSLGLTVEDRTWKGITDAVPGLTHLSAERIKDELLKVLGSDAPSRTLDLYERSGAFNQLLPELSEPLGADVLTAVDIARPHRPLVRMALFLLGGLQADEKQRTAASVLLRRLCFSKAQTKEVVSSMAGGLTPEPKLGKDAVARRRWMAKVGASALPGIFRVWIAAHQGRDSVTSISTPKTVLDAVQAVRADLQAGIPLAPSQLAVNGHDLLGIGLSSGRGIHRALCSLLESVWEEPTRNSRGKLLALAKALPAETNMEADARSERASTSSSNRS